MKKWMILLCTAALVACNRYDAGIPAEERQQLATTLESSSRPDALRELFRQTPRDERAATAWLLNRMTPGDRDTMRLDLLRENVAYACRARREFPWAKALPEEIFRNEVLPYASVDEVRDAWRRDFYERFAPRVAGCSDMRAAIDTVNRILPEVVGVEYNTLREKTNQSPAESMRQGMASCTGLSILLVDALRAVGIPARFAGTAAWHDERGNHSWTEVWIDGEWYFTEYYQPAALDRAWFLADAGQAVPGDRQHAVYAVSFAPTGDWFPMVWNEASRDIHATDVSQRYRDIYATFADRAAEAGTHVQVTFCMFRDARHTTASGDRVAANVDVFCGAEQMGGGRTAGPLQDMNDALHFLLEKNRTYTFRYAGTDGEAREVVAQVGEEPLTVTGYME
ncbi:transglutaminase domain-containing protein [uncultured Alistipes sp.]|uniref:transglutaminase-like domain-containing protein n=1 Tax=uncultured Alistipes sp. TaxID=538949 RepID=UPI00262E23A1|nr:transglutaminase domain-containing protein [uncultured Alistipes sp.]